MNGMPLTDDLHYSEQEASLKEFDPFSLKKIPTGVADLDGIVGGGFPSGSLVLLSGDVGAGMHEYAYTGLAKIAIVRENPRLRGYFLGEVCNSSVLPEKICYVTFSRSKEVILQDISNAFNPQYLYAIRDATIFKDLSRTYFRRTLVPQSWTHQESLFNSKPEGLLESLIDFLDGNAENSLVIIDSLTDLVETEAVEMKDLISTIKGLQRASKKWDGIVYLILTRGIMEKRYEQMIEDSVDGVLIFEWRNYLRSSKRQRYLCIEKFTGVLPHLAHKKIARFPIMITSNQGLVVVYLETIS